MATYVYTPTKNADGTWTTVESVNGQATGATSENRNWSQGSSSPTTSTPSTSSTNNLGTSALNNFGGSTLGTTMTATAGGKGFNLAADGTLTVTNSNGIQGNTATYKYGDPNYQAAYDAMTKAVNDSNWSGVTEFNNNNSTAKNYTNINSPDVTVNDKGQSVLTTNRSDGTSYQTVLYGNNNEALRDQQVAMGMYEQNYNPADYNYGLASRVNTDSLKGPSADLNTTEPLGYTYGRAADDPVQSVVRSLYNQVGQSKADGTIYNYYDLINDLNRMQLQDYAPGNALLTASGTILPGNDYGYESENDPNILVNGKPQAGTYYTYGNRTYLMGGDAANLGQYANLVSGGNPSKYSQLENADYILGNVAGNPLVQQDKDASNYVNAYMNQIAQWNSQGTQPAQNADVATQIQQGIATNVGVATLPDGQTTQGLTNASNTLSGIVSGITSSGNSDILSQILGVLGQTKEQALALIGQWRTYYEQQAQDRASSAWVNSKLRERGMAEQLASAGLGTSGAMIGAMNSINAQYGNDLKGIYDSLDSALMQLSEQEYQAFKDYATNVVQYTYQYWNDSFNQNLNAAKFEEEKRHNAFTENLQQQTFDRNVLESDRDYQLKLDAQEIQRQATAYDQNKDAIDRILGLYANGSLTGPSAAQQLARYGVTIDGLAAVIGGYKSTATSASSSSSDVGGGNPTTDPTLDLPTTDQTGHETNKRNGTPIGTTSVSDAEESNRSRIRDALTYVGGNLANDAQNTVATGALTAENGMLNAALGNVGNIDNISRQESGMDFGQILGLAQSTQDTYSKVSSPFLAEVKKGVEAAKNVKTYNEKKAIAQSIGFNSPEEMDLFYATYGGGY